MSDLISRQAAIDVIEKYDFSFPEYMKRFVTELRDAMKEDLKEDIAELPPVQPERKPGRWLFGFDNKYLEKFYYCSNCGCRKYTEDEPSDYFCSNCGADMRGGETE